MARFEYNAQARQHQKKPPLSSTGLSGWQQYRIDRPRPTIGGKLITSRSRTA
ncbi:hypothetical protein D3C71_1769560 [compost metagenome]